jgi:hypothetical protein
MIFQNKNVKLKAEEALMKKITIILVVILLTACGGNSVQQAPEPTATSEVSTNTVGTFAIISSHLENEIEQDPEGDCVFPEEIFKDSLRFDPTVWQEWEDFEILMNDPISGNDSKFTFKLIDSENLEITSGPSVGEEEYSQTVKLGTSMILPMGIERSYSHYLVQGPLLIHKCEGKIFINKQYQYFQAEVLIMPGNDFMIPQEWKNA